MATTYYINKDQLGETTDAEAANYLAAVREALPIDVVLCPEGQPQSNTSEVESLYGELAEQIWDEADWYTPEGVDLKLWKSRNISDYEEEGS